MLNKPVTVSIDEGFLSATIIDVIIDGCKLQLEARWWCISLLDSLFSIEQVGNVKALLVLVNRSTIIALF